MHGNSDDDVTLCVIEVVVASPDADHLKPGFPESTDHLRTGGPRKYYVPALLVFRGTETSTGIGLPSFLATSTYPRFSRAASARQGPFEQKSHRAPAWQNAHLR